MAERKDTRAPIGLCDLVAQHRALASELTDAVLDTLFGGQFILSAAVAQFEREFAAYCGARYAVGVSSGTAALTLALRAVGVGPGDEVIVPAHTFIATVHAVLHAGATPVLVDVDETSFHLAPEAAEASVSERTKAILPVHLYGQVADMQAFTSLARRYGLVLIEDAAQAHGATLRGRRAGSFGVAAGFSMYPAKNLGAAGDAGVVTTRNRAIAARLRRLRDLGRATHTDFTEVGDNARLDSLQAAILRVKLAHLDAWNERRGENAAIYDALLADLPIQCPVPLPGRRHVYHQYVIRTRARVALVAHLEERGIKTGVHYPKPLHRQRAFRNFSFAAGRFPVAERLAREVLSLPVHEQLAEGDIGRVAHAVRDFFDRSGRSEL
jgi:dTDP-4-amino-4,6-dideoxygalactose transaminase